MNIKYFKLVPVSEEDVHDGMPHVAVVNGEVSTFPGKSPDWARHIQEGSAAMFNMDTLIKQSTDPVDPIHRHNIETAAGNTLQVFYNPGNDLVVVDLIAANERGGNELFRKTLDESKLLKHTTKP